MCTDENPDDCLQLPVPQRAAAVAGLDGMSRGGAAEDQPFVSHRGHVHPNNGGRFTAAEPAPCRLTEGWSCEAHWPYLLG